MDISAGGGLVVIDSGPAGEAAAMQAAKKDLKVAIIEEQS